MGISESVNADAQCTAAYALMVRQALFFKGPPDYRATRYHGPFGGKNDFERGRMMQTENIQFLLLNLLLLFHSRCYCFAPAAAVASAVVYDLLAAVGILSLLFC